MQKMHMQSGLTCLFVFVVLALLFSPLLYACKTKSGVNTQHALIDTIPQINTAQLEALRLNAKLHVIADSALRYCIEKKLNADYCFLVDMGIHSGKKRFFIWDFKNDSVTHSGLCCHGYGMGSTQAKPVFSNVHKSYCSSVGKYKTGVRAYSNWGIHVHYKLYGLDATNSNAYARMVVLHSYSYVPDWEIYPTHLPLGYSQGCPVIDNTLMTTIDEMLKKTQKPVLLWIFCDYGG